VLSLRSFHLFFIAASIALALATGAWGIREYGRTGEAGPLVVAGLFLLTAVGLAIYRRRFARKVQEPADE
jgi:hypothetical protein